MINDTIRWSLARRDQLPDLLLGDYTHSSLDFSYEAPVSVGPDSVALGWTAHEEHGGCETISVIGLPDSSFVETLSWLHVYAREFWPLAQYARVVLLSDWHGLRQLKYIVRTGRIRADRWASVAVGEVLAQSDGESQLNNMPLSRLLGCYSTTIGRAALLHGHDYAIEKCVRRLKEIEQDGRFVRRFLSIDELTPVWELLVADPERSMSAAAAVQHVLVYTASRRINTRPSEDGFAMEPLRGYPGLVSDSVEDRVLAFQKLSMELLAPSASVDELCGSAILAAGAFLVGRGTSHMFLLRKFATIAPAAPLWFAAMAALTGPAGWDAAWLRNLKGAEKLLRSGFGWKEPSPADVTWPEYNWLASSFEGTGVFMELPRMLPKSLSVEILPGVTHHARLTGPVEQDDRQEAELDKQRYLQDAVSELAQLTTRIRMLVGHGGAGTSPAAGQQTLPFTGHPDANRKRPKNRAARKDQGRTSE